MLRDSTKALVSVAWYLAADKDNPWRDRVELGDFRLRWRQWQQRSLSRNCIPVESWTQIYQNENIVNAARNKSERKGDLNL